MNSTTNTTNTTNIKNKNCDENPKCDKCSNQLTNEEFDFFENNDLIKNLGCKYLCKSHWCDCMPNTTPWKYLTGCSVCGKTICKTCKYETGYGSTICDDCLQCLYKGGKI